MHQYLPRGEVSSQVSTWNPSSNAGTPAGFTSSITPYGLQLQQTITSSGTVTIPAGITFVYAICVAGGGGGDILVVLVVEEALLGAGH
jgi:hypothetical protein